MIRYYKLFDLMNRRDMKPSKLLEIISAPTLGKLKKGDIVRTDTIDKICLFLDCQPNDIMEVYRIESLGENIAPLRTLAGSADPIEELYNYQAEEIRRNMQKDELPDR